MKILDLWVPGMPKTKGSMAFVDGRTGYARQSVQGSDEWARVVRRAVGDAGKRGRVGYAERQVPVRVDLAFWVRGDDVVRERAGDVDKLTRNVLDALTRNEKIGYPGVYADDVQVVQLRADRWLANDGMGAGLHVAVTTLTPRIWDEAAARSVSRAWYAWRDATDPGFEHADGATLGHNCFQMDCGQ